MVELLWKTGGSSSRFLKNFFNVFFLRERERKRECMHTRKGEEREGHTESKAGSSLWAVSTEPDAGLELVNCKLMTWAKVDCLAAWASQAPQDVKHSVTIWFSNSTPRYIHDKRDDNIYSHKNLYINVNSRKQPKCPSTNEWINKMWYIHTINITWQ